jgi:hypothetical protein
MDLWFAVRTFAAFFLLLFGLALLFGPPPTSDPRMFYVFCGAFVAALGLSLLWRLWVKTRTGR